MTDTVRESSSGKGEVAMATDRQMALFGCDLVDLLRREGRHSGVWFADRLLQAADALEALSTPDRARAEVLVIIESPYAGDVEENVAYARACMRDSLERGEAPIASHLLYTQPGILCDDVPEERQRGISAGLAWRAVATKAVFYTDRGWSEGMIAARAVYQKESFPFEERALAHTTAVSGE